VSCIKKRGFVDLQDHALSLYYFLMGLNAAESGYNNAVSAIDAMKVLMLDYEFLTIDNPMVSEIGQAF
jgi:hypothetical protein